jgi:hypothetical protein
MALANDETASRLPSATATNTNTNTKTRAGGAWLVVGSVLGVASLVLHPPPSADLAVFMATIADDPTRWALVHWVGALAVSSFVVAGLLVLTAGSRLTRTWWTASAWALLVVAGLWVTTAALAEATVIAAAAAAGDTSTFEAWLRFADAHDFGFVAIGTAIAAIAVNEARAAPRTTPTWAAWVGAVAGMVVSVAFVLGLGVGIEAAIPAWLVSLIVMLLWTGWFGVSLVRSAGEVSPHEAHDADTQEAVH